MKQPTTDQRIEHVEESARRVIGAIASLAISNDPGAIRDLVDRHRAQLDELRQRIATATTFSPATRDTLDRLDDIIATVTAELNATRARLDSWAWIGNSTPIVAGITNDLGVVISIAIASILSHIANK